MRRLVVYSPAKVNLYLNVLRLRLDGYHEIQTILNLINLQDKIILEENKSGIIVSSSSSSIPTDRNNLAWRAASRLMDYCRIKKGVKIFIEKKIPVAAGLGGGSSNAAAVLLGLNKLWGIGLAKETIAKIGEQLGADVPFFVRGYPVALATGIGEKIVPIECGDKLKFILVNPNIEISTASIYQLWDRLVLNQTGLTKPESDVKIIGPKLRAAQIEQLAPLLYNSLERVALSQYPAISEIKKVLIDSGVGLNLMSGSGPTVFGVIKNRKEGSRLKKYIQRQGRWWVCLAESLQLERKGESQNGDN